MKIIISFRWIFIFLISHYLALFLVIFSFWYFRILLNFFIIILLNWLGLSWLCLDLLLFLRSSWFCFLWLISFLLGFLYTKNCTLFSFKITCLFFCYYFSLTLLFLNRRWFHLFLFCGCLNFRNCLLLILFFCFYNYWIILCNINYFLHLIFLFLNLLILYF